MYARAQTRTHTLIQPVQPLQVTDTSAKTRDGVDMLFQKVGRRILNEVSAFDVSSCWRKTPCIKSHADAGDTTDHGRLGRPCATCCRPGQSSLQLLILFLTVKTGPTLFLFVPGLNTSHGHEAIPNLCQQATSTSPCNSSQFRDGSDNLLRQTLACLVLLSGAFQAAGLLVTEHRKSQITCVLRICPLYQNGN